MSPAPLIIEQTYSASIAEVWKAMTNKEDMKQWYFDLEEFKPEVGFEFRFLGGPDENSQYLHICKITEVIPERKLSYSWRYEGQPGNSLVTFELFEEGTKTRLKLTHSGLETFSKHSDFARKNFVEGWTHITGTSLKAFVEK
jgi:uncharacterized protein YndB with AHSA1/START domain